MARRERGFNAIQYISADGDFVRIMSGIQAEVTRIRSTAYILVMETAQGLRQDPLAPDFDCFLTRAWA